MYDFFALTDSSLFMIFKAWGASIDSAVCGHSDVVLYEINADLFSVCV